ncbi:hypothetical protein T310_8646, partial [Rasamsonia emersonii CBS 393.64]
SCGRGSLTGFLVLLAGESRQLKKKDEAETADREPTNRRSFAPWRTSALEGLLSNVVAVAEAIVCLNQAQRSAALDKRLFYRIDLDKNRMLSLSSPPLNLTG